MSIMIKVRRSGKLLGEYPVEAVHVRVRNQSILPTDEYWTEGMSRWESVSSCKSWTNFSVPLNLPPIDNAVAADSALAAAVPAVAIKGNVLEYDSVSLKGMISADNGARYGFSGNEWRSRTIRPKEGVRVEFVPAGSLAKAIYALALVPVAASATRPTTPLRIFNRPSINSSDRKDRAAYILLAVLAGCLGVHNFYAGYKKRGLTQILCTFLTCTLLALPMWVWAIIEACIIERDSRGVPFK